MYRVPIKYYKYLTIIVLLYLILILLKNIININTIIISIFILLILYYKNTKLFKKIVYNILFKNKDNFGFKNKYVAAKVSLEMINKINNKVNNKVNAEILNYEKNKLEKQLKYGDYNVTLFGTGSSGKTSLARALLNSLVGKTSSTIGTTKEITSYKIRIPILKRNINIIDTPGLFEASKSGEEREKSTIIEASKSDLVLFVLDQDLNKYEFYFIKELSKIGKKIIVVLNKCDLRSENENYKTEENIVQITSKIINKISVVQTIASPKLLSKSGKDSLKRKPDVANLFRKIIETLDENGEELLADNILFRSNKLGSISKNILSEQRDLIANKVINKYTWITGGVVLLNPLPAVDFITTTSVNVKMIIEISKIYDKKITKNEASDLSKSLLTTLAKLGILKGGMSVITSTLTSNFTTIFISKSIQSITSGWLVRIVGLTIIEYFKNGQSWGDDDMQEVLENIYKLNKRKEILDKFINEAIIKIKIKKDYKNKKILPPNYQKD